jgi:hypothetical protein
VAQYAFDQLIEAIAGAVVEAEAIIRQRQIANILSFFHPDGTPNTIDFKIHPPGSDPAAIETPPAPLRTKNVPDATGQLGPLGLSARASFINVSPPANARLSSPTTATVKLRVVASDPPEGLARLIDRLNITI